MTARVVSPWQVVSGTQEPTLGALAESGTWRVWVEDEAGRFALAGIFEGTEAQAVAAALIETGNTRGIAIPETQLRFAVMTTSPGDASASRGAAPRR